MSVSNPKSIYVAFVSVLSQISNCQGLGRKNKHETLKTDRTGRAHYSSDHEDMAWCASLPASCLGPRDVPAALRGDPHGGALLLGRDNNNDNNNNNNYYYYYINNNNYYHYYHYYFHYHYY